MFLILLFKLLTNSVLSLFSLSQYPLSAPFLNPLSSPSSFSSDQFFVDKDFNLLHSVHQWHIFLHSVSHHDILIMHSIS